MKKDNIILVGFMATGKTTVGKILATELGMKFIDTDEMIVERARCSIEKIFSDRGETYFRSLEEEVILSLMGAENMVIATGGGAVINPFNRQRLGALGWVLHLEATRDWIIKNLKRSEVVRPLLKDENIESKIDNLLVSRKNFYSMADYTVSVDHKTPDEIVQEIKGMISFLRITNYQE